METLTPTVEDLAWIAVEDASAPGRVRRAASDLARKLGFSDHREGEVALATSELATNLFRHARAGKAVLRVRRNLDSAAIEIVALDAGPGVADLNAIARDGYSTAGTLGVGIGTIQRLASSFECHSVLGKGTVAVVRFWPAQSMERSGPIGGITRAMTGEMQCGDAWAQRTDDQRTTLLLVDGLGHGELAAMASRAAVRAFGATRAASPAEILGDLNIALRATRGAAAAVVVIDSAASTLAFAGVGNIAVWIDGVDAKKGLASSPGIVGAHAKPIREILLPIPPHALVVMHSDGLTSKWNLSAYPGLRAQDCLLVAATLIRDAGVHHDDASAVVARVA